MYNHQLDTFLRVAEAGSFSKAAADLFITPTAVIKQMNLLESLVGAQLFNRSHRGLSLTPAGEVLQSDARRIIEVANEALENARSAGARTNEVIRVGSSPMTPTGFLTEVMPQVRKKCPSLAFKVVGYENEPATARRLLANMGDEIDIVGGIYDEHFLASRKCAALPLRQMRLDVAMAADHPLAQREEVRLDDLDGCTLLLTQRGWNSAIDELRDFLQQQVPGLAIEEFPVLNMDIFNRCEMDGCLLMTVDLWSDVHPLLVSRPVQWDCEVTFGILHNPNPSSRVQKFLEALQ